MNSDCHVSPLRTHPFASPWPTRRSRASTTAALLLAATLGHASAALYDPTTYNYQNPTFVNDNFTNAQKAAQRNAGAAMMQALVNAARSGQASYTIAPSTYRVNAGTCLTGINNFTLNCPNVNIWLEGLNAPPDANGSTDGRGWLTFDYSTNIKILGGNTNFDSENLQFIQAIITGWNAKAGTIDIQVMPGYDAAGFAAQQANFSWIFSQAGVCKLRPVYSAFANLDPNDITKKGLTVGTGFFTDGESAAMRVGDIFFTRHNCGNYNCVIGCNNHSTNVEIDGINSWHGPMWFLFTSRGSFVTKNCSNYRRPGTNRIASSIEPLNYGDAKTFVWDGCTSGGPGIDDGIDFSGLYSVLPAVVDRQHVILNFQPSIGANLNFFDPETAAPQGTAKVVTVTPLIDSAQQATLSSKLNQYQTARGFRYNNTPPNAPYWTVALDRPVAATQFAGWDTDDLAASISVTNSYFADMNAQALFVKGRQVTITGNRIDRGNGSAIYASVSRYWDEGPVPQNVTISNNVIIDNPFDYHQPGAVWGWAAAAIEVCVEGSLSGVGAINNVVISGNKITNSLRAAIEVENAANVKITSNTMTNTMTRSPFDAWLSYNVYAFLPNAGIFVASSRGVTLSGNTLPSPTSFCPNVVQLGPYNAPGTVSGNGAVGWTALPINCTYTGSNATYASNTDVWTLNSNGNGIAGSADQFLYVSGVISGDRTIETQITSMLNDTDPWAKAGLMLRDSTAAGSKMASVSATSSKGVAFQCRAATDANTQDQYLSAPTPSASSPVWLRLSKQANTFSAYYSPDHVTWKQVGVAQSISFANASYRVGLVGSSRNGSGSLNTATFVGTQYLDVWNVDSLLPICINSPLPDAGAAYTAATGTWNIVGAGADINGTADQFCFVRGGTHGDRTFIAKVTSMTNTDQWAKTGLMFRDSLNIDSAMATVDATPLNGVQFICRAANGAATNYVATSVPMPTPSNPVWLKLQKIGNTCMGYYSLDGTSWAQVGTSQTIGFNSGGGYLAGLAALAHGGPARVGYQNLCTYTNVSLK